MERKTDWRYALSRDLLNFNNVVVGSHNHGVKIMALGRKRSRASRPVDRTTPPR
jgi:hypothetical protein